MELTGMPRPTESEPDAQRAALLAPVGRWGRANDYLPRREQSDELVGNRLRGAAVTLDDLGFDSGQLQHLFADYAPSTTLIGRPRNADDVKPQNFWPLANITDQHPNKGGVLIVALRRHQLVGEAATSNRHSVETGGWLILPERSRKLAASDDQCGSRRDHINSLELKGNRRVIGDRESDRNYAFAFRHLSCVDVGIFLEGSLSLAAPQAGDREYECEQRQHIRGLAGIVLDQLNKSPLVGAVGASGARSDCESGARRHLTRTGAAS